MKYRYVVQLILLAVGATTGEVCRAFPGSDSGPQPSPMQAEIAGALTVAQIQVAVQKAGGEKIIEKEATKAISHFGNKDAPYIRDLTDCPAITEFATLIDGRVLGVWPDGGDIPAHVRIRRGSHRDYQFIYIFAAGTVPATNSLTLQPVSGSVYLRNTSE